MSEPITPLSASRMKTAQSCSWLYWSKYKLDLPDGSNDGAKRGSICHLIFEVLGEPRRKKIVSRIIKTKDVFSEPSIERLIMKHAQKMGVDDEENIESIKEMTLNGILHDFYGKKNGKPTESISEKDFEITHQSDGVSYKIKGFIDKLFLYKNKKFALIRDFKSSKQKFKGKEISDNLQDYMYSLAVRHMYPDYVNRQSEFLFLKFALGSEESDGVIKMDIISEEDLDGFEIQLTEIQKYLDNFSEKDAVKNMAASQPFPSDNSFSGPLQCGFAKTKGQLKKDGTLMWHCPMKFDFDYYVVYDESDKMLKSYLESEWDSSLVPKNGRFEKKHYEGCPKFKKR